MTNEDVKSEQEPVSIYDRIDPFAHELKAYAQMGIALILFGVLCVHACVSACHWLQSHDTTAFIEIDALKLVSVGLMYAAGVELCYMLCTKGPDEAIVPVILGLASAVLLVLSDDNFDWRDAIMAPALVLSMGVLFYLHETYVEKRKPPIKTKAEAASKPASSKPSPTPAPVSKAVAAKE